MKQYDFVIIGGGAAGLSAGMYAARYRMKTLLVRGEEPGGETAIASIVENYPGFKAIDGFELIQKMEEQAKSAGVEFMDGKVEKIDRAGHWFHITVSQKLLESKTICLAMGSKRRKLGLPNEERLRGKGISYCATCDAPLYKGKVIAIAGGGDSSVKGAYLAAAYAKHIYLITREESVRGEPINLERMKSRQNVEVITETTVTELKGKSRLEGIVLSKPYKGSKELKVSGLFIEIGAIPRTELPKMLGVGLDEQGYIKVDQLMRTNVDGVFASGDITNGAGDFRQDIMAAAQGAMAATTAYKDLGIHGGELCPIHAKPILSVEKP